jgi:GTPase SAR1 family protein
VTNRASFEALEKFLEEIKELSTEKVSIVIVGNKTDEVLRVVSTEEGQGMLLLFLA